MTRARFLALVLPSRRTCSMPSPLQHYLSHAGAHADALVQRQYPGLVNSAQRLLGPAVRATGSSPVPAQLTVPHRQRARHNCSNGILPLGDYITRFSPMLGALRRNCSSSRSPLPAFPAETTNRKVFCQPPELLPKGSGIMPRTLHIRTVPSTMLSVTGQAERCVITVPCCPGRKLWIQGTHLRASPTRFSMEVNWEKTTDLIGLPLLLLLAPPFLQWEVSLSPVSPVVWMSVLPAICSLPSQCCLGCLRSPAILSFTSEYCIVIGYALFPRQGKYEVATAAPSLTRLAGHLRFAGRWEPQTCCISYAVVFINACCCSHEKLGELQSVASLGHMLMRTSPAAAALRWPSRACSFALCSSFARCALPGALPVCASASASSSSAAACSGGASMS